VITPADVPERISPLRTQERVRFLSAEEILAIEELPAGSRPAIQSLTVRGLLSFGEETEFNFGRLNVLVGPNGSGKSNLIDCLRILRFAPLNIQQPFEDSGFEDWLYRVEAGSAERASIRATLNVPGVAFPIRHEMRLGPLRRMRPQVEELVAAAADGDDEFEMFFLGSPATGATVITPGARRRERELRSGEYDHFQSVLSQLRDMTQYPEITRLASLYASFRIYSEWSFGRRSALRNPTPAGRSDTVLSEQMDDLAVVIDGLLRTPAHEKLRDLLQEVKETYRDIGTRLMFGRLGLELVEVPFQTPLPASRLSDGTLRFLALAAILLQPNPPALICLEEPELGMHPDMIRTVGDMIADAASRTQLVVTTHSEHLLSSLQDEFDVLFAFDAGINGSVIRRFGREQYEKWREDHMLGELWTSGYLGGNRW
jgi:predicted ATPase